MRDTCRHTACNEAIPTDRRRAFDPLADLQIADDHLRDILRGEAYLLQDGAMGSLLQQREAVEPGGMPDVLNIENPAVIEEIHAEYVAAGAELVTTNTFSSNAHKLNNIASVADMYAAAIRIARNAGARYVGADIGPIGSLLEPLGVMSFDEAYVIFTEQVKAAYEGGADLIIIETMSDLLEAKAALLAAKEHTPLPILASMTYAEGGRTFLGTSPEIAATTLSSLGANIIGINCSFGPDEMIPLVEKLLDYTACPISVRPNAGMPHVEDDKTVYDISAEQFADTMRRIIDAGVTTVGGCCGTEPSFIAALADVLAGRTADPRSTVARTAVTSAQSGVFLEEGANVLAIVGERINPNGKPRLKEALRTNNYDYLISEAVAQQQAGADILDVNVGLPEIDEEAVLTEAVRRLQAVTPLPLQVDSSDPAAVEAAVRIYAGKPLINSVNGKEESLHAILPIAAHYGCSVVALTLDEGGIPATAEERIVIAERIVDTALAYGIPRTDIVIDCLTMAAATNQKEAFEILKAVSGVKAQLGVRTTLGVSNISFGLPEREVFNAAFLAAACGAGLDLPIINPLSERYRDVVYTMRVLNAQDEGAQKYIAEFAGRTQKTPPAKADRERVQGEQEKGTHHRSGISADEKRVGETTSAAESHGEISCEDRIAELVLTGQKSLIKEATENLLAVRDPQSIIDDVFIPILDDVGERFERGEFFLPQMMASAEAVKAGFDALRASVQVETVHAEQVVCLATVKGDIHDIGKNIVKMLLENYGYRVVDLGRDVSPEDIVATVKEQDIKLVGLSALMTTTVRSMEDTIALLHKEVPDCKVFVGGAVLSAAYANTIGADYFGKDAAEAARIVGRFFSN